MLMILLIKPNFGVDNCFLWKLKISYCVLSISCTNYSFGIMNVVLKQDFRIEEMKITARAAIGSANYQGDLSYIKDNEPKYLDFEKFKAMDEFLKTSENS